MTEIVEDRVYARHRRRRGAVLIVGAGAVGGFLAEELARLGVSPLRLVDLDVLEVENLVRHPLGAGALGQPKAPTLASKICLDFPLCDASGLDADFLTLPADEQLRLVSAADVIVAATDSVECQRRVNEVCLAAELPAVYPAVWVDERVRDAEVGEILWVLPGQHTPCYLCATAWRQGGGDTEARGGTRADIQVLVLATAQVVAGLLDRTDAPAGLLDPGQTCIYVHGFSPPSPGVRSAFQGPGLQSRAVHVPFPRTTCPACGGQEPRNPAAAARTRPRAAPAGGRTSWPTPGPPPQGALPEPPRPDARATSYRRLSIAALIAAIAVPAVWIYGSTSYTGGRDVVGDLLRALLGVTVFIGSGIVLFSWLASLPEGRRALRREEAAREEYRRALLAHGNQIGENHQTHEAMPSRNPVNYRMIVAAVAAIVLIILLTVLIAGLVTNQPTQGAGSQPSIRPTAAAPSQPTPPPPASGYVPPSTDPGQTLVPAGATILGSVNLARYCQDGWGMYAVLRFPNTWGWRCSTSPAPAAGNRHGDQNISVTSACVQQYGDGATPHYRDYANPNSWFCYRS